MPVLGDRGRIAIQYQIDNKQDTWLYGKICFWINGEMVGDYSLGTSLRDVLLSMNYFVSDSGKRSDERFLALSPQDIFSIIEESLYAVGVRDAKFSIDIPARFNISFPVDVFDEWRIYLVDLDQESLLLYKNISTNKLKFFYVPKAEFDSLVYSLWIDLNQAYDFAESGL